MSPACLQLSRTVAPIPPSRATRYATHAALNSGVAVADVEQMALAFLDSVLRDATGLPTEHVLPPLPTSPQPCRWAPRIIFDGGQAGLCRLDELDLLAAPTPLPGYKPTRPIGHWISRMVLGADGRAYADQYLRDLGLDLERHTRNLRVLRQEHPRGWTSIRRTRLADLAIMADGSSCSGLIIEVVQDHALALAALRARMLAEYLRRLAVEPMGSVLDEAEPVWQMRGKLLLDRLAAPAASIDRLLQQSSFEPTGMASALEQVSASGLLAYDPRLLTMARHIYQRCEHLRGTREQQIAAAAMIVDAVRGRLAALRNIRQADIRDSGLGRESVAQARLGLTVPQAVNVLAMNLVAFPPRLEAALAAVRAGRPGPVIGVMPPTIPNSDSRVRRIATVLKAISGCDRHHGDTSPDPDNKAGRKLLRQTRAVLEQDSQASSLAMLRLDPGAWLR